LAVAIRLSRRGANKKPFYRVVAVDKRKRRDGRCLEVLGTFDPLTENEPFKVDLDKARGWIQKGAKPSDTVASFLKKAGVEV